MDKTTLVQFAYSHGDTDGKSKEASYLHRPGEQPLDRLEVANILEHQHGTATVAHDLKRPHRPGSVQLFFQSVFVGEVIEACRRWVSSHRQNDQDGAPAAILAQTPSSAEDAFAVLP